MAAKIEFEIRDHGCDGEQYFPGCGTAFTTWTDVSTGIGESAHDAGMDAWECAYIEDPDSIENLSDVTLAIESLSMEEDTFSKQDREAAEEAGEELNPEWHHYVSIRWRIVEEKS